MNTKTALLLVLSASLLSVGAQAKPEDAPSEGRGENRPSPTQIIERMDADQNGTISKDEAKGPLAKRFDQIDADGDGELTKKELAKARKKRGEQADGKRGKMKEADTDNNGALSYDEASAAELEKIVEHFDKLDADGDGEITKEEMRAMKGKRDNGEKKDAE